MTKLLLFVILVSASISLGSSLWCYSCTSYLGYNNNCQTYVNNRTVAGMWCSYGYTACMTLVTNSTVTRSCALPNVCSIQHGYRQCNVCSRNFCNNRYVPTYSGSIGLSAPIGLSAVLLTMLKLTA